MNNLYVLLSALSVLTYLHAHKVEKEEMVSGRGCAYHQKKKKKTLRLREVQNLQLLPLLLPPSPPPPLFIPLS